MAQENRTQIKTYFQTGDVPTQSQFGNSFDSQVFWVDDVETDLTSNSDLKVPTVKAVVDGIAAIPGQLTSDELDAIQGSSLPSSSNVFITDDAQTFTKDANDNVFYNGVSPTLGTSCSKNIFHKTGGAITLGNGAIGNIFEPTENTTNFVFGANLRNVTIKAGNYPAHPTAGTLTLTSGSYTFLYNKDYPAQIFIGANANAYHSYFDGANNRYVITNLVTLASINIGGGGVPYTGATADVDLGIHSLTADTIGIGITAGAEKLHIDGGASTTRVKIDADNGVSRILSFRTDDVQRWALRVDGVESGSNSGADFQLRRYNDAGTFIDHPISINRATGNITTSQNLTGATPTEMGYLSGVTSSIQTQLNTKIATSKSFLITFLDNTVAASTTSYITFGSTSFLSVEANRLTVAPAASTFSKFYVKIYTSQSGTGSFVFTLRKNQVDTAVVTTIAAGSASGTEANSGATSVAFSAGDDISIKAVNSATATSARVINLSCQVEI